MTRMTSYRRSVLLCTAIAAMPAAAWAQQSGGVAGSGPTIDASQAPPSASSVPGASASNGIAEIVVTAQKRSQSVNSVPLSVTAVTGDMLAQRGITSTEDLVKVVPGLTFTPTAYNTPVYTLRGIGYFDNALASSPAVSVYVDEVPLSFPAMTEGASLDVERVEVLKGPQGTLYGQNSTGGAINYIAAKPTSTWQAGADLGYARFNETQAGGFISGPITDTLKMRIAVHTEQGGAWQESETRPGDKLGNKDKFTGRLLLSWTPSDRLHFNLNINGWTDNSDTLAGQVVKVDPSVPALATPLLLSYADRFPTNARQADWTKGTHPQNDNHYYEASLRTVYDLTSDIAITSITSYQHYDQNITSDVDATAEAENDYRQYGDIKSFNQELRLSGNNGPVNWIVGGNYAYGKIHDNLIGNLPDVTVNNPVPGLPRFTTPIGVETTTLNSYAGFANAEVKILPRLSVIGGLRYTQTNKTFNGCSIAGDPGLAGLTDVLQLVAKGSFIPVNVGDCQSLDANNNPGPVHNKLDENNLSIRAAVDYKLDNGMLFYASFNRGYKAGGFPLIVGPSASQYDPIPQEQVMAYEAGVKLPFFNHKLQLNAAGFYYDYKNKQLKGHVYNDIFDLLEALVSVPKSRVIGGEIELQAHPLRGLDLSLAGTYVNSKVQKYSGYDQGSTIVNLAGTQFPFTPKLTAVADAQYQFGIDERHELFVGAGAHHSSSSYDTFVPTAIDRIKRYTTLDLRAGIQAKDGRWRVTVFGDNVTNEYYWNGVYHSTDEIYRQAAMPATYGVSFSVRFK